MMNTSIRSPRRQSPKIVSIPVHFVGSAEEEQTKPAVKDVMSPVAAAVKVQKVGRGYLVRKSVKKVVSIRNEVEEIERRISRVEVVELMIKEPKERLRVNETLMALLFKLDSVRGVDSGVRDLRKAVIKKAIALQERVDGIVVAGECQNLGGGGANNDCSAAVELEDSADCCLIDSESALDQTVGSESKAENLDQAVEEETVNCGSDIVDEQIKEAVAEHEPCDDEIMTNSEEIAASEEGVPRFAVQSDENLVEENCAVKEIDRNCDIVKNVSECFEEEHVETSYNDTDDCAEEESSLNLPKEGMNIEVEEGVDDDDDDNKRNNRDLLEKMMEDNEKMMNMMKKIFERNEQQSRMLNSLSHRVEQLEKAFICDRLRKKKKRQQ